MLQDCASWSSIHPKAFLIPKLGWYTYEYLLTLFLEIEAIWKSKPNITIILFLINRYVFIISQALFMVLSSVITNVTVSL